MPCLSPLPTHTPAVRITVSTRSWTGLPPTSGGDQDDPTERREDSGRLGDREPFAEDDDPERGEVDQITLGERSAVIDGRVAFQKGAEDDFTAAIERLTGRRVTAFLSANQTAPGVACELFFLESPAESTGGS